MCYAIRSKRLSSEKAKEIITKSGVDLKIADKYDEHELIKVVNVCKQTKFQAPNTDHLSPIGEEILIAGMTSEYTIVTNKEYANSIDQPQQQLSTRVLRPVLTGYSSRTCVVNNRPTIVECGIAYGGDISSFKSIDLLTRFLYYMMKGQMLQEKSFQRLKLTKWEFLKRK